MLQEQQRRSLPGTGPEAEGEKAECVASESGACGSDGAEGQDAAAGACAGESDHKDAAAESPAGTAAAAAAALENADSLPEQEQPQQQQQQQQQKKKSRRNKSKSKGVSLAAHPGTGGESLPAPALSPLVHVNDSRLVLQQPMPNPFVRNATQPYAPLLHPPKDSATDGV